MDPHDSRTQNSSLSFTGFISASGALGMGVNNYTFFTDDRWRLFVDGAITKVPTGFWGIGYDAAQGSAQDYTNNSVRLRPVLMREVIDNFYIGAGWDFSSMQASVDSPHEGDRFSHYDASTSPLSSGLPSALTTTRGMW